MKGPFRVYLNNKPVTVPIEDENRAAIAYNILVAIGEEGGQIDGKNIISHFGKGLHVVGTDGESIYPDDDPEWSNNDTYYDAAVQKAIMQAAENGETIDHDEARNRTTAYTIIHEDTNLEADFMPATIDKNKAMEWMNFLKYGMDPSVKLEAKAVDLDDRDYYYVPVTGDKLQIQDFKGNTVEIESDPDWAKGQINPDVIQIDGEQDFEDAVAAISENQNGLEQ